MGAAGKILGQTPAGIGRNIQKGDLGVIGREGMYDIGADARGAPGHQDGTSRQAGICRKTHVFVRPLNEA
jgi:hypothetical protein